MLGRYVYKYLESTGKYDVVGTTREQLEVESISFEELKSFGFAEGDVIINCIGQIKQYSDVPEQKYWRLNTLFPLLVNKVSIGAGAQFIHITTDCVFSGEIGNYTESARHDAEDIYGVSKSLGEPRNCTIIRTSIIGEELKGKLSLLEWVKSNAGKTINGFMNHRWNGITCLQYAKICEEIIDNDSYWQGVLHVASPTSVNKYELSKMISDVFDLGITVNEFEATAACDRTLATENAPIFRVPGLLEQLKELKDFGNVLRG